MINQLVGVKTILLLGLSHDTLANHYKTNFALIYKHRYSLTELDNMLPYEREINITLLTQHLEDEKNKLKG